MKNEWRVLAGVCALVVGVYVCATHTEVWELSSQNAACSYYNLLVQGFRAGQLNLKGEVPPGLTQLADPYDPAANNQFRTVSGRLHDLSYYKGKLYMYFGITPALILLWPFVAFTGGHYLFSGQASAVFCAVGFLAEALMLRALWRRYFSETTVWVVAACTLALGLGTAVPVMLPRSGVYEVPVSCGYALTMLTLAVIWKALHETERRWRWLGGASVAYGLAVGARPSLLFGSIILLVPVAQARCERRPVWALLLAAIGPIMAIGLGLMLYNELRFDSPFEFGQHYQLASVRQIGWQFFHWRYLWFNFRVYFLEPVRWSARFPFVHEISLPPLPAGYLGVETPFKPFGVLANIPLVWLALAAPLAWRRRSGQEASTLRWFVVGVTLLFGACVLTLLFFEGAMIRYEVEFLPTLMLLATAGILGLDRALAGRLVWRRAARWGWGLLLVFSVAFNIFASVVRCAEAYNNLGTASEDAGKLKEATEYLGRALRLKPDYADAHFNLAIALAQTGKIDEAIAHYQQALRINPDFAEVHNNLGDIFLQQGKLSDAIAQFQEALQIKPDFADAQANLGSALASQGRLQEAITHYGEAIRIKPDFAGAYYNRGVILEQVSRLPEAVADYEEALRIKPDYARAHFRLGASFEKLDREPKAIEHYEQALRINPDYVEAHFNLGLALEKLGRVPEAIDQYQQALKLRPDFTAAKDALARLCTGQ